MASTVQLGGGALEERDLADVGGEVLLAAGEVRKEAVDAVQAQRVQRRELPAHDAKVRPDPDRRHERQVHGSQHEQHAARVRAPDGGHRGVGVQDLVGERAEVPGARAAVVRGACQLLHGRLAQAKVHNDGLSRLENQVQGEEHVDGECEEALDEVRGHRDGQAPRDTQLMLRHEHHGHGHNEKIGGAHERDDKVPARGGGAAAAAAQDKLHEHPARNGARHALEADCLLLTEAAALAATTAQRALLPSHGR